jgi:uncharacterized membrane protein
MEIYISQVLRIGVLISGTIILAGLALYIIQGGSSDVARAQLSQVMNGGGQSTPTSPASIWHGLVHGSSIAIIQLGVLALILTPMTRVAMTAGLFLAQRDKVFVAITSVVFIILVLGLIGVGK